MRAHSHASTDQAWGQLRKVVNNLGRGGGAITPSIYETAQVLRFYPELVEVDRVITWLLRNQQPDGGWGEMEAPLYRIVPTLAAILALRCYRSDGRVGRACAVGYRFLEEQDTAIVPDDSEYLPVAVELILPRLLDEMSEAGMGLAWARFKHIEELGDRRRKLIAEHTHTRSSPPVFSWEAWGVHPDPELVGSVGGVGHSPAATAWWLRLDKGRQSTCAARSQARDYIAAAARATGLGIHGVVPGPWPINRFEQSFVLQTIEMAGLLTNRHLTSDLGPQLEDLRKALSAGGLGFSDHFAPDGDDTAAAVSVLTAAGLGANCSVLAPFERSQHFVAYPFEMHMSFTVTARATQAMSAAGRDVTTWRNSIVKAQQADGWWPSEKWNRSRLYGTSVALRALDGGVGSCQAAALEAYLNYQHDDGGWGCFGNSTPVETAFAVLALKRIGAHMGTDTPCTEVLRSAHNYLRQASSMGNVCTHRMWISKDLFSARRIDRATILCARLALSVPSRVWTRTRPTEQI